MNTFGLIWAQSTTGIIGRNGTIPWHLHEDQRRFKKITMGCPVVMGRKTWESLPERVRPLPGRTNIVLTHNKNYQAPGAQVLTSLEELPAAPITWVIGGADLYQLTLPQARRCEVTEIALDLSPQPGDIHSVQLDHTWTHTCGQWFISTTGLRYRFHTYYR